MLRRLKRWLFLTHRWLGVALCVFFVMWFVSGVVMMYVGYPRLTQAERVAHLPALGDGAGLLAPGEALLLAGVAGPLRELRLAAGRAGRPAYFVVSESETSPSGTAGGRRRSPAAGTVVIDAMTGERLTGVDRDVALASAAAFADAWTHGASLEYAGLVEEDAFTHSRALDAHRPLHRIELDDPNWTRLYVSSLTGEVVRDATRTERGWNFVGAWIHWLYPFRGNGFDPYWSDIVIWLSVAGTVVALLGIVIGVMRWRFRQPYRSGARTPYTRRMMRWHHVSGLLFALVTLAWIFSGLMSMNPWRIFDSGAAPLRTFALQGTALLPSPDDAGPAALLANAGADVRELRWSPVLGTLTVQAFASAGRPSLLESRSATPWVVDATRLREAAAGLLGSPLVRVDTLDDYDFHYYARAPHTMTGGNERPLPALRFVFDDPQASWVHVDPHTGAVLARTDSGRRASRWLFALLHSWDWLPLLERRPLWDGMLVVLSMGGALLSATGVVIGWRRLSPVARRRGRGGLQNGSDQSAQGGNTERLHTL